MILKGQSCNQRSQQHHVHHHGHHHIILIVIATVHAAIGIIAPSRWPGQRSALCVPPSASPLCQETRCANCEGWLWALPATHSALQERAHPRELSSQAEGTQRHGREIATSGPKPSASREVPLQAPFNGIAFGIQKSVEVWCLGLRAGNVRCLGVASTMFTGVLLASIIIPFLITTIQFLRLLP